MQKQLKQTRLNRSGQALNKRWPKVSFPIARLECVLNYLKEILMQMYHSISGNPKRSGLMIFYHMFEYIHIFKIIHFLNITFFRLNIFKFITKEYFYKWYFFHILVCWIIMHEVKFLNTIQLWNIFFQNLFNFLNIIFNSMNRFLKDQKVCLVSLIEQDYRYDKKNGFQSLNV